MQPEVWSAIKERMTSQPFASDPDQIANGLPVKEILPELRAVLAVAPTPTHPASAIVVLSLIHI